MAIKESDWSKLFLKIKHIVIKPSLYLPSKNENKGDKVFYEMTSFTEITALKRHTVKKNCMFSVIMKIYR